MRALVTIDFVSDPATVRMVRKLAAAAARMEGATDLDAFSIELAIGEVLAQGHSWDNGGAEPVSMRIDLTPSRLIVSVIGPDRARQRDKPTTGDTDHRLGRGLYIVAQVMDEVEIRQSYRKGQASELRLVKRLGEDRSVKKAE